MATSRRIRTADALAPSHVDRVAAALRQIGLVTYLPSSGSGFGILAAGATGWPVTPVEVRHSSAADPDFDLLRPAIRQLVEAGGVAVFVFVTGTWFIPIQDFLSRAADNTHRKDEKVFIPRPNDWETKDWLDQFEGETGLRRAFRSRLA